jgi:hypothetical protein
MRTTHLFAATVFCIGLLLVMPALVVAGESPELEAEGYDAGHTIMTRVDPPFLLIPESSNDTVGMYDPMDGTYLGDLITVPILYGSSSTPINAVAGPDGYIYVSDQLQDAVFRFNMDGTFFDVYADNTDGLNNIRGIDFRDGLLYVTSGDDYVAVFDGPHNRLADFINDGSDPFDIHFLPDGRALLADIYGSTDAVRLYNADGSFNSVVFSVNFPEQIQSDSELPGEYLNAAFSADWITDFDVDGTVHSQVFWNGGRGVFRLGNGNLLATAGDGVWEVNPADGSVIEQENTNSSRFIELVGEGGGAMELYMDIKPGNCPNVFNPGSNGVLKAALLGTEDFDVTMIDVSTVVIARADETGGEVPPIFDHGPAPKYEDVATPFMGELCDCHNLEGDGFTDLYLSFDSGLVGPVLELEGMEHQSEAMLMITGELTDGTAFEAYDCVKIVGKNHQGQVR